MGNFYKYLSLKKLFCYAVVNDLVLKMQILETVKKRL
jgi:hypothetical protein